MPVKTVHHTVNELYFCTFTCCDWINLFEITRSYDLVYNWFTIAHAKGYRICAFVIMPNHLHFIMASPLKKPDLNMLVSNGKRFMAYAIVERLKAAGETKLLNYLAQAVQPVDRRRGKLHKVFKSSFAAMYEAHVNACIRIVNEC